MAKATGPMKYFALFDWKETIGDAMAELKPVLKKMGVYVYEAESQEGSDNFGFIFSQKPLSKKELQEFEDQELGLDEEEEEGEEDDGEAEAAAKPKSKKTDNKELMQFLKKNKIRVKDEMVHVDDSYRIPELVHKFHVEQAKKLGLPKALVEHMDKEISINWDYLERAGQEPEKYDVVITDSQKNYDQDDTWSGTFKGTVKNLWSFFLDECELDPGDIEDRLLETVEEES